MHCSKKDGGLVGFEPAPSKDVISNHHDVILPHIGYESYTFNQFNHEFHKAYLKK